MDYITLQIPTTRQTPLTASGWQLAAPPRAPSRGRYLGQGDLTACLCGQKITCLQVQGGGGAGAVGGTQQENKSLLQGLIHKITDYSS